MESALSLLSDYIPAEVDILATLKFAAIFATAALAIGFLLKLILGQKSELNQALSSVMGILCVYALTVVVYTFNPRDLSRFLSPLPFVGFSGEYMMVMPISATALPDLCQQILSMVILAFLMNLIDAFMPRGKSLIGWYGLKALTVIGAMALHYCVNWALNAFLPGVVAAYAQTILLGILVVLLLIGVLNVILTALLSIFDPIVGALYHFFFATVIGRQLSKAVLSSVILCAIAYLLEYAGYTVICISTAALGAYIPLIAVLLILWYIIGHIF